jgi:photosystem II stability/assembly factor-like uncharacterized protein
VLALDALFEVVCAEVPVEGAIFEHVVAVSAGNSQVVWAAGTGGVYLVTTDSGQTWKSAVVPGAEQLQFRNVYAVSDKIAYLMSIGNDATNFRIYKTFDGGKTWKSSSPTNSPTHSMIASRSGVRIAASHTATRSTAFSRTSVLSTD